MSKMVSSLCAGVLAGAALFSPISTAPALADEAMGVRAYMSLKFGSGAPVKDAAQYGFQLNRSWDNGDEARDPFATPRSLTVFDFAMDGEGLARANLLGLDTITVYDIMTGGDRLYQNAGGAGGPPPPGAVIGGLIAGGVIACVVFDLWPCDDDDDNPPPQQQQQPPPPT